MPDFKNPAIHYSNSLPAQKVLGIPNGANCVLLFDNHLLKIPKAKKWISSFKIRYGVKAGEDLKDLAKFPKHMVKLLKLTTDLPAREMTFVVLGGGSVGDFGGFVASIYKRGVRLIQIPSTWLAAVDSAHGGKTALNVSGFKNQIGTFYQAEEIYIVRDLLVAQPKERFLEALNEILKIALIEDGELWQEISAAKKLSEDEVWRWLALAIAAKYKIVEKDPFEKTGYRQILNLGHTFGHVVESAFGLSHGEAIGHGLKFALQWSDQRTPMGSSQNFWSRLALDRIQLQKNKLPLISREKMKKALLQDKKRSKKNEINFVFLSEPGKTRVESIGVEQIVSEAKRQGLIK